MQLTFYHLFLNDYTNIIFKLKKGNHLIHLIAVLSMLLWGLSYIWTKIVFKYYQPLTTVFLRLVLSSIILLLFIHIFRSPRKIQKQHFKLFAYSALFNPFLYFIGESFGLSLVSSTMSAVIISTIPLFTPLAAYFSFKEKISPINLIGIFISFFGILLMVFNRELQFNENPLGILILFGAVAAAVIYGILLQKLAIHYSSLTIIAYQNAIGVIYFLPFFLFFEFDQFIQVKPNLELISSLLLLAVFASSIAFILYTSVVRKIGITKGNIYTNLIPGFTAVFAYFILAEEFPFSKILGMIVVILGVILSQINRLTTKTKTK